MESGKYKSKIYFLANKRLNPSSSNFPKLSRGGSSVLLLDLCSFGVQDLTEDVGDLGLAGLYSRSTVVELRCFDGLKLDNFGNESEALLLLDV